MFENVKIALYRFHILSAACDLDNYADNCNINAAAYKEIGAALKLVEGQKPTTNSAMDAILKEADILRKAHPSKDCRFFAESVFKMLTKKVNNE